MTLTLDAHSEELIERELARGTAATPADVVARALELFHAEEAWSNEDKLELDQHLAQSFAQSDRGELYTGEQARAILAERRASRT